MNPETKSLLACYVAGLAVVIAAACAGAKDAACAKYGTLEVRYAAALQDACGDRTEDECNEQRPGAVQAVDDRFRPEFEEAESCQAR